MGVGCVPSGRLYTHAIPTRMRTYHSYPDIATLLIGLPPPLREARPYPYPPTPLPAAGGQNFTGRTPITEYLHATVKLILYHTHLHVGISHSAELLTFSAQRCLGDGERTHSHTQHSAIQTPAQSTVPPHKQRSHHALNHAVPHTPAPHSRRAQRRS